MGRNYPSGLPTRSVGEKGSEGCGGHTAWNIENDLAVSGARPLALVVNFVLEAGIPGAVLREPPPPEELHLPGVLIPLILQSWLRLI